MKVVRKLLAPLLVVGILLTSLIILHQLKADKKKDVFRIGISQFITHQSLDAFSGSVSRRYQRRLCG